MFQRLMEILGETTQAKQEGSFSGWHAGDVSEVDCHFVTVGVNKRAAKRLKEEFAELLLKVFGEEFFTQDAKYTDIAWRISEVAPGITNPERVALQIIAFGGAVEFWQVATPASIGFKGAMVNEAAKEGLVMARPFLAV